MSSLTAGLNWMHTSLGSRMYPEAPVHKNIAISDIANGLALICRYGGQGDVYKFYSVAEHSVLMAQYALEDAGSFAAMYVLLHDASEAYLGDLVPAVKNAVGSSYAVLEDAIMNDIMRKYSAHHDFRDYAKTIDRRIVPTEKAALMRHPQPWPSDAADPLPVGIECWRPVEAKMRFLSMWEDLRQMNGLPDEDWEI